MKRKDAQDHATFMRQCMEVMQDDGETEEDARDICELLWEEGEDVEDLNMKTIHKTNSDNGTTMEFVLSDETPDRYGDIIQADGWDLKNFKKNPIALFNHNSDFPIGRWEKLQVVDNSLRGYLKMAPAGTSPRIDEIRNLIEAGILRAVSVGFRPVESTALEGSRNGGRRYLKSELLETSLVSVPANPNAIAVAKSLNVSRETLDVVFAKNGEIDNSQVTRNTKASMPKNLPTQRKSPPMNIAQRITEAQTRLTGLREQLDAHIESIDDANATAEQMAATDAFNDQIESQTRLIESLKRTEAAIAKTATLPTVQNGGRTEPVTTYPRLFAAPKEKVAPKDLIFKALAVDIKHFGEGRKRGILEVLKENYGENEMGESVRTVMAKMVTKAATIPADTTTSGWADTLVQTVIGDFIESLMPLSVYPQLRARGGSFTFGRNGTISLPSRTTSTAIGGAFVAQGAPIPVKQGAFSAISLTPKKMGVITTLTREISEHSTPAIEAILRDAILDDTAVAIDTVLLDATAASTTRPAGLKNGQTKVTATAGGAVPAALLGDLKGLYAALITATNGNVRRPVWIMNPGDVLAASLIQTTTGDTPFREEISRGTLLGIPIIQTTTGLSDMMGLIDAADFITATGDTPSFSVSDQAVLHMEDTSPSAISTVATPNTVAAPVRSLWQTDTMAIRMIMDINWAKRRTGIFQWTDTMTWN